MTKKIFLIFITILLSSLLSAEEQADNDFPNRLHYPDSVILGTIYVVQSVNNTMTVSSKSISYSGEYASLWAYDMDIGSYKNLIGVVVDYSISGKGNTKTGTISWEK